MTADPYWDWHREIERARGKAKTHLCALCDKPARDWALKEEHVEQERLGTRFFITDLEAYEPLCRSCHLFRDRGGVPVSEETRKRQSAAQRRRFDTQGVSASTRSKISKATEGLVRSPETREKMAAAKRGVPNPALAVRNRAGKGRKLSEETKQRMSAAHQRRHLNKK